MAAELKTKKVAKMGHHAGSKDTGHKVTIPCGHCGGTMEWSKVKGKMRYCCASCSLVCDK